MLELKNAASEDATIWTAFQQLQTYKTELPAQFVTNAVAVGETLRAAELARANQVAEARGWATW